ncbi:MAG: AMP-binding protein, partial [Opitutales bacterium]|nr:AMP-binding protein [Opitutales bacterium]
RWTFAAGEPLKSDLVAQWKSFAQNSEIINLYGPTETTLAKCWYQVPESPLEGVQPIGAALPGVDVSILNQSGDEAGIGEIGEIGIRTPYASLGYLDEESDHYASFTRCPWMPEAKDLIYRTGDQGRLRPDGVIEILGRVDDQIKIRGIRIEPKEVESSIEKHPQVKNSRVLGIEDPGEGKVLVAYIVKEGDLTRSQLGEFLAENLPQAMIPRSFVFLDEIPLTVNGKLDRDSLPKLELNDEDAQQKYVAPRTPIEESLACIFEELLKVKRASIEDNFFHLGGNSLLVVRLCYRVFKELNEKLQVASVFKYPTVAMLAKHLGDSVSERNYLMRLNNETDGVPIFFIPGISRTAIVHAEMSKRLDVGRPCYGLELPVPENGVEPLKTLEELANHCVQEIKKVQPVGPYTLGGFSFGGVLAYEVGAQLYRLDGMDHRVFMFDSRHRIEKSKEPPPSTGRLEWIGKMLKAYKFSFFGFFIKSFFQHHILWRLGLWDGYNERGENLGTILDSGLPYIMSDAYHYNYKPKSVPLRLTVFTVRQFLFTRKGQSELMRWDKCVENQVDYVLVKTDNHLRIMDEENLDLICERMREDLENDDLSNQG